MYFILKSEISNAEVSNPSSIYSLFTSDEPEQECACNIASKGKQTNKQT